MSEQARKAAVESAKENELIGVVSPVLAWNIGWNAHAEHTADLREKAAALVAYVNSKVVVDSKLLDFVAALKTALEKNNG